MTSIWLARYQGEPIFKLAPALFWSPSIGTRSSVAEIRRALDAR